MNRGAQGMDTIVLSVHRGRMSIFLETGLAIAALGDLGEAHAPWLLAGALLYSLGCAGVTMALNVPLNEQLRRQAPGDPGAGAFWRRFLARWTAYNTLRTVAALAGAAALVIGVAQS